MSEIIGNISTIVVLSYGCYYGFGRLKKAFICFNGTDKDFYIGWPISMLSVVFLVLTIKGMF